MPINMYTWHLLYLPFQLACYVSAVELRPFILPSPVLFNAATLPASTHATLTTLSQTYTAPLRLAGDFYFSNVTTGSYLMEIYCHTHFFPPRRVDVHEGERPDVQVWGTFRGNEWDNKGEAIEMVSKVEGNKKNFSFAVSPLAKKEYFNERLGFSPLSLLKNPMILIAGLTMLIVFGMPYLMDHIDPELKTEFEERQKSSADNPATANPLQNFDAAAWLAGSKSGVEKNS
ncbi:hypothetical protein K3495_g9383 [Podosphaera aphanis]|nr:hypothetical protein K3495_g9383 [Podosphaera aphanis]